MIQAPIVVLFGSFWGLLFLTHGKKRTIHVTAPDTRIFSPLLIAGLSVAIGRYWYLFKRLTAVSAGRFYRFEHIVTYSSGKVVAKSMSPTGHAHTPGPTGGYFRNSGVLSMRTARPTKPG
jgi:hypothetical protein